MVVSGQVTLDNIMLDKVTLSVISEYSATSTPRAVPDAVAGRLVERGLTPNDAAGAAHERRSSPPSRRWSSARRRHYKCPQDIELALDADLPGGEMLWPQPRPETVATSKPAVPSSAVAW